MDERSTTTPGGAAHGADTHGWSRRVRRGVVLAVLVAGAVLIAGWAGLRATGRVGQPPRPKNVLLITMDTTRADYLGCYGNKTARTPNIDRLAREGTRFEHCTTCAPLTLPSHASMMTAVYPYVHGARENGTGRLAEGIPTLAEAFRAAGYATQATIASFVLNPRFGLTRGFDVYHSVVHLVPGDAVSSERRGDEVCDDALTMLRSVTEKPFFLWVHFYDPHYPYLSTRTKDVLSPLAYADELTFMDTQIGRLLDELGRLGHERDTLVVAVADHGESLNDHDEWHHGYFLYETTLQAALLLRCPGVIPATKTVAAEVRTIDLAPTILELVRLPAWEQAQGISLLPLMRGPQQDLKLAAYSETSLAQSEFGVSQLRSLTADGWKYVWKPNPELYHLSVDPEERQNLLAAEPQRAAEMHAQLRQLIADAPPAPAAPESTTVLNAEDRQRLASLGYVGRVPGEEEGLTELERFEPRGADPMPYARSFKLVSWDVPRLIQAKDYAQAEQVLRQLMAELPDRAYLPVLLAGVLDSEGRTDEALQTFEHAAKLAPDDYAVCMKYGLLLRRLNRPQEALAQFALISKKLPNNTEALNQAALALATLGDFDSAETKLRRSRELEPKNAGTLRILGLICEQRNELQQALSYFKEALTLDPSFRECEEDRARVLKELGW